MDSKKPINVLSVARRRQTEKKHSKDEEAVEAMENHANVLPEALFKNVAEAFRNLLTAVLHQR